MLRSTRHSFSPLRVYRLLSKKTRRSIQKEKLSVVAETGMATGMDEGRSKEMGLLIHSYYKYF